MTMTQLLSVETLDNEILVFLLDTQQINKKKHNNLAVHRSALFPHKCHSAACQSDAFNSANFPFGEQNKRMTRIFGRLSCHSTIFVQTRAFQFWACTLKCLQLTVDACLETEFKSFSFKIKSRYNVKRSSVDCKLSQLKSRLQSNETKTIFILIPQRTKFLILLLLFILLANTNQNNVSHSLFRGQWVSFFLFQFHWNLVEW